MLLSLSFFSHKTWYLVNVQLKPREEAHSREAILGLLSCGPLSPAEEAPGKTLDIHIVMLHHYNKRGH